MSQEKKTVILVLLIVVLGLVAYFVLFRQKVGEVARILPGAATTTTAPASKSALPAQEDVALLKEWLAARERPAPKVQTSFGLLAPTPPPTAGGGGPDAVAAPGDPLRLDGILQVGRTAKAVIAGDAYGVGQTVKYTPYTVVAVMSGGVKLRSNSGQELVLVLQK